MVPLEIFGFLNLSLTDILDILMVAFIIYYVFRWIKGSAAMNIFFAVLVLFILRVVVEAFNMRLMSAFLGTFLDLGVLALIIIFQPEIRHFLIRFGNNTKLYRKGGSFLDNLLGIKDDQLGNDTVNEIVEACRQMSADKTGALIVIPHKTNINYIIETGDRIDSNVNRRLIMNLFFKNSPGHPAQSGHEAQGGDRHFRRNGRRCDCGFRRDRRHIFRQRRQAYPHKQYQ